ncbi:type IV toxin-antitoxin system AbiEi family antitoxin domain-containing protein [Streptomyces murinus]|uniref:type IV toxin-antitoxin system AbiEi family antitoxin domain-containing protein n=1 Tax=Streptomyces murinus TaxID=33900 RepID=UPI00381E656A
MRFSRAARHPCATSRQVAQALGVPERRVMTNLRRLTDDGLLTVTSDGASGVSRSSLLPPVDGEGKGMSSA